MLLSFLKSMDTVTINFNQMDNKIYVQIDIKHQIIL